MQVAQLIVVNSYITVIQNLNGVKKKVQDTLNFVEKNIESTVTDTHITEMDRKFHRKLLSKCEIVQKRRENCKLT